MKDLSVARRYARALYEEATKAGTVARVDEDIAAIDDTLKTSRDLARLFESPIISREKKDAVITALFGERISPIVLRFFRLLIENKREDTFPAITHAYRELRDHQLGIVEAHARVAFPLTEADRKGLVASLEKLTGKQIRLLEEVDTSLIGGVVIRLGDTVYDGSVRNKLENLRDQMTHAVISAS